MVALVKRTSLGAIGFVLCGLLSAGLFVSCGEGSADDQEACERECRQICGSCLICAGWECILQADPETLELEYVCDYECGTLATGGSGGSGGNGGGGTGGTAGMGGSAGTGGTGGGTPQPLVEDCTNGLDDDRDTFVDCGDVSDCACDRACVGTFIEACAPTNLLTDPGFEQGIGDVGPTFPREIGKWGGDLASVTMSFTSPTVNIEPFECRQMAQFDSAFIQPLPNASTVADRVQLINATGLQGQRICGTARFARDHVDNQTDSLFNVVTAYFIGGPAEFTDFAPGLPTSIDAGCFADGRCGNAGVDIPEAGVWKFVVSSSVIPTGTEAAVTALINVRASENKYNDVMGEPGPEFDGHFVDDARLFAVPSDPNELSESCRTALSNVAAPPPEPPATTCP